MGFPPDFPRSHLSLFKEYDCCQVTVIDTNKQEDHSSLSLLVSPSKEDKHQQSCHVGSMCHIGGGALLLFLLVCVLIRGTCIF